MEVKYRKMEKKDYKSVQMLIRKAWYDEYEYNDSIKNLYAKGYFYQCYGASNYSVVATVDDEVVGFIFGRYRDVSVFKKVKTFFLFVYIWFLLVFTKAGRRGIRVGQITNKADKALLKGTKKEFDGELALFIVSDKYQRMGIGSKLQNDYYQFMKNNNAKNYYLYTDTFSDYTYYEKRGYKRLNTISLTFNFDNDDKNEYYIYEKVIE